MRILAVNWLDRMNPEAGGAEVHFFEIFRRLVALGHEVTLVVSGWRGAPSQLELDGLRVVRTGSRYSFALKGRATVRKLLQQNNFDVVVEDINKVPLYLPTLTSLPVYVIIPHLFGTTAFAQAPFPIAATVWLSELPIPRVYRRSSFHVISQSTRADIISRGVDGAAVRVIYPGVDSEWLTPDPSVERAAVPTFLYTGRLQKYKGVEVAIRAVAVAHDKLNGARLQVAGAGGDRPRLERLVESLGVVDLVEFLGYVSEERKRDLMRRAWAVVFPSAKEGWGITNIEAAACGTPAIASDSPGLRETAIHDETGYLVNHGDVGAMSDAMVKFGSDSALVARLGANARIFSKKFSWDEAASLTEQHLLETI